MSDSGKAVFLSYASQDAEAAQRICEALRAAGVEVWFDQNELVGGDAWDQKIRGQISSCALFVPILSANTQARREGYFRIEWRLAAQRTHAMADGTPFLVPVVIDGTKDADALVPPEYKAVQWTRLPGGETPAAFCGRVKRLLADPVPASGTTDRDQEARVPGAAPAGKTGAAKWWWVLPIFGVTMALALVMKEKSPDRPAAPPAASPAAPAIHPRYAASRPEVGALLTRVFALTDKADVVRAEQESALKLLDQAERLDPTDANVAAERALVELRYVHANLDATPVRLRSARMHARQAVSLDPKNPSARLAEALTLLESDPDDAGRNAAGAMLDELVAANIDRVDAYLALSSLKVRQRKLDAAAALLDGAARLPGGAGRAAFQRAMNLVALADAGRASEEMDRALRISRSTEALMWKAYLTTVWLGDAPAGLRLMDEISPTMAMEDYPASGRMFITLWTRDYPAAVATLRALNRDYLESGAFSGPTGYYIGYALARDGKRHAAEVEWRSALAVVDERLKTDPTGAIPLMMKSLLLAELGDRPGADKLVQTVRELHPRALSHTWEGHLVAMQLLPPEEAFDLILQGGASGRYAFSSMLGSIRNDPFMDHLRSHPKFADMLAQVAANPKLNPAARSAPPGPEPGAAPPPEAQSVAVLAFANLSDDKANEYFSDGISEELLNVLAKVPGLKVSARTSAFHFKGKDTSLAEIARQLGVAYVVEGSVRKQGDKVRISAKLIKAADGFQAWSDTFTRDLKDIFAVQDEIAGLIAHNLQLKLELAPAKRTVNPEAHRLVLEGRYFWNLRNAEGFNRAEAAFRQATELDPNFAEAYAGLAGVHAVRATYQTLERSAPALLEEMRRARTAAEQAVALSPDLAEAQAVLAYTRFIQGEDTAAEAGFVRALELNPNAALTITWSSTQQLALGRLEVALRGYSRAAELDPLWFINLHVQAEALYFAGREREALTVAERAAGLRRDTFIPNLGLRAILLERLGRHGEALALARQVRSQLQVDTRWHADVQALQVLRANGAEAEATAYAAEVLQQLEPDSPMRGQVLAAMGRFDEALPAIQTYRSTMMRYLYWDPVFDPWRADERFKAAIGHLGKTREYAEAQAARARLQAGEVRP